MEVLTILFFLALPLLFILGLGEIASRMMRNIWVEFHELPRRKSLSLFRRIGYLGSFVGLVLGYYWGYHQPTVNCGLCVICCGLQSFFNGIRSSVAGAILGAFFSIIGVAFFPWLRELFQRR